jgi:subtilisin family serine protease
VKWLLLAMMIVNLAQAKPIVIAVIDTGIDPTVPHLCQFGHWSFDSKPLEDTEGHGTHISGLITKYAEHGDYCLVSLKYYQNGGLGSHNLDNEKLAFRRAIDLNVDFINLSGGGADPNNEERALIEEALSKGIKIIVAAGNDGHDLSVIPYYPACYDNRITVVGNLGIGGGYKCGDDVPKDKWAAMRAYSSNYGPSVNRWEVGTACISNAPGGQTRVMYGTSQSTAIATGKLVKVELKRRLSLRK